MSTDRRPLQMTTLQYAALQFAIRVKELKGWETLPALLIQAICSRLMTATPHRTLRELVAGGWVKFDTSLDGYVINESSLPPNPERLIGPRAPVLGDAEAQCLLSHWDAGERAFGDSHFLTINTKTKTVLVKESPPTKVQPSKPKQPPIPPATIVKLPKPPAATPNDPLPTPATEDATPVPTPPPQSPVTPPTDQPTSKPENPMSSSNELIQIAPRMYLALQVIIQFAANRPANRFTTTDLQQMYEAKKLNYNAKSVLFQLKRDGLLEVVGGKLKSITNPSQYRPAYGKKYFTGTSAVVELVKPSSSTTAKPSDPTTATSDDPPPTPATGEAPPALSVASEVVSTSATAPTSAAPIEEPPATGPIPGSAPTASTTTAAPATEDQPTEPMPAPEPAPLSQEDADLRADLTTELDQLSMTITGLEADLELALREHAPKVRRLRLLEAIWTSYGDKFAGSTLSHQSGAEGRIASALKDQQLARITEINSLKAEVNTLAIEELRIKLGAMKGTSELILDAIAKIGKPSVG